MEKFYTPRDVEREFGIERSTLTHWRAKLIGPDCIRWKDKILYHARDIEKWFKIEESETESKPKKKSKRDTLSENALQMCWFFIENTKYRHSQKTVSCSSTFVLHDGGD